MEISGAKPELPLPVYAPASSEMRPAETRQLIQAIKALNAAELFGENNELTFVLDRETNRPLVRIINKETKEVIRQIPPEYALEVAKTLRLDG